MSKKLKALTGMGKVTKKDVRMAACPRCGGTREEPGAPVEDDGSMALCTGCGGKGQVRVLKLRLTVESAYAVPNNGPTMKELKGLLEGIPEYAEVNGMFTGETDVTLEDMTYSVTEVKGT